MEEGIKRAPVSRHVSLHGFVAIPLDHPSVPRIAYHPEAQGSARLSTWLGVEKVVFRPASQKRVPVKNPVVVFRVDGQSTDFGLKLINALRRGLSQTGRLR